MKHRGIYISNFDKADGDYYLDSDQNFLTFTTYLMAEIRGLTETAFIISASHLKKLVLQWIWYQQHLKASQNLKTSSELYCNLYQWKYSFKITDPLKEFTHKITRFISQGLNINMWRRKYKLSTWSSKRSRPAWEGTFQTNIVCPPWFFQPLSTALNSA